MNEQPAANSQDAESAAQSQTANRQPTATQNAEGRIPEGGNPSPQLATRNSQPMYARGIQRSITGVTYPLERRLPVKGTVFAKLGETVKPETVVAEGKVSAGVRMFRLGELLSVAPGKAQRYLHRTIGSRVYEGDVIAEVPKMFGLRTVQFVSPIDGIIQHFNPLTGQLTLQFAPATFRLPAGVRGVVSQLFPDEGVLIETQANLIFGAFTSGNMREGAIHMIAPPDQPMTARDIDAKLAGHILVGGSLITKDVLNRCLAVGVRGIVTGGITAHDLLQISGTVNSQEDIGLTLLITSGLGNMPMEQETYQLLNSFNEQQAFLVPKDKMLVVPQMVDSATPAKDLESLTKPYLPLQPGARVRLLSDPHVGEVATFKQLVGPQLLPFSRMSQQYCLLQRDSGATIEIPVTNLEIVATG